MGDAIIDNASKLPCMVTGILRRTPDARDAEFSATALHIVVGAIHLAPGMAAAKRRRTLTVVQIIVVVIQSKLC